ncbi:hypothetical protein [Methylovirgula sp. 4M-Z18]|uniref:hypothetical protein n=1 Tax=Methylovirgula sp. 4M-Z18 TaxID=2293567 RepID=UPI000E2FDB94|nr:hypothetical protein [Methylovirgula sp. 4M-Z18]RFB75495.1 hypothetical protein DYH55_22460 [Methylovirgula sp. 4M-Z18]
MTRAVLLLACMASLAGCADNPLFDDPSGQYLDRIHTVTPTAGNAMKANEVAQVNDPWPRYVHNTRIPGDSARLTKAIERYENPDLLKNAPPPIEPIYGGSIGVKSGGGG